LFGALKDKTRRVQYSLAGMLEMPKDAIMDLPRITVIGNWQINIENHRGLLEYTADKVRVSISNGELEIKGNNFVVRSILVDEITLDGQVYSISFSGEAVRPWV